MKFYVIYSVDIPRDQSIAPYRPPGKKWMQTEGDSEYEYSYLEGDWSKGKHRKYVALLGRKEFDLFLDQTGLFAERVGTGGSLTEFGWLPAISFRSDDPEAILDAYVTPVPQDSHGEERTGLIIERDWERVKQAVINTYS